MEAKTWNPSQFNALRTAYLSNKAATWICTLLLCFTLSLGFSANSRAAKAGWGVASLSLLAGAWVCRNSSVWIGQRVKLTDQALLLAFAEWLVDSLVPATAKVATEAPESESPEFFDWSQLVTSPDSFPHLMLLGKTGAGKSFLAERLLHYLGGGQVITPHRKPSDFQGFEVVGAGRNYQAIAQALNDLVTEMDSRYQRYSKGDESYPFLNVVIDEFPSISANCDNASDSLKLLAREARKVKLRLIILSQGDEVKTLGIEGEGSLRECFTFIRLKGFAEKHAKALKSDFLVQWVKAQKHPCLVEDSPAVSADLMRVLVPAQGASELPETTVENPQKSSHPDLEKAWENSAPNLSELPETLQIIVDGAKQNGGCISVREAQRLKGISNKFSADQVREFFSHLKDAGWGTIQTDDNDPRRQIFWLISNHPEL